MINIRESIAKTSNAREHANQKVIGLKHYGLDNHQQRQKIISSVKSVASNGLPTIEELENEARQYVTSNSLGLMYLGIVAAVKVMIVYLVTLETILACALTVSLTIYWYKIDSSDGKNAWNGSALDFILLAFAVTSPLSAAIGMAFSRRERALIAVSNFRSFSYHLFMAHCMWDWSRNGGRAGVKDVDWLQHCDAVMAQLVGIGDELCRFLTLPTTSRGRHRMTKSGRREAAKVMEVAYLLMQSMSTQRMTRLQKYSERIKKAGLSESEVSRMRQYERFLCDAVEQLRMVKMYRTPQALRAFGRIFTLVLPPFYAPSFAQVAKDLHSLPVGIMFGVITALALTALFETLEVLEDPFTAFLALDGIDVREEFEVLHFMQLSNTRNLTFPDAPAYPLSRRAAMRPKIRALQFDEPNVNTKKEGAADYPSSSFVCDNKSIQSIPSVIVTEFMLPDDIEAQVDGSVNDELGEPLDDTNRTRETSYNVTDDHLTRGVSHRKRGQAMSQASSRGRSSHL